jgi:hypothetical protein
MYDVIEIEVDIDTKCNRQCFVVWTANQTDMVLHHFISILPKSCYPFVILIRRYTLRKCSSTKVILFCVPAGGSKASKASDVAVSCLERMVMEYQLHHMERAKDIAALVFRLLIVHPKVFDLTYFKIFLFVLAFILTLSV